MSTATVAARPSLSDTPAPSVNGYVALLLLVVLTLGSLGYGFVSFFSGQWLSVLGSVLVLVCSLIGFGGLYVLEVNDSAVLTLFGDYRGTDHTSGLRFSNPFYSATKVSRRLKTHIVESIKVNDAVGNPIEVGAAVVWRVTDSAAAALEVDDYRRFVEVQSDAGLRKIAGDHAYDELEREDAKQEGDDKTAEAAKEAPKATLLGGGDEVIAALEKELNDRFQRAGIQVHETRITHLAYAPEIASAMLRRQQASAVISARRQIVKGAVDMVNDALEQLKTKNIELDPERRAAMVSNLLVVLVGDKDATPIVNAGTLYS